MTAARLTHLVAHVLSVPGGPAARITQCVVQTLSDADSTGEARISQLVVQTLSDSGEAGITDGAVDQVRTGSMLQLVAEITMAVDSDGNTETFLVTNGVPFATLSTDTPASTVVYDRMQRPATLERTMFSSGTTFGAVSAGYGVCEIANADGLLDAWADYNVAGQTFVLRAGVPNTPYPSQWTTILRATMQAVECDIQSIRIRLRDRIEILQRALLRDTTYPDPVVYGQVYNVPCKLVDSANLVYAAGRPPSGKLVVIQSLRDNGVRLTHQSGGAPDYANTIATEGGVAAASVTSGRWNFNADSGRLKVGAKPSGVLTATLIVIDDSATWSGTDGGANVKVGTILSQMAQAAGVDGGDIVLSDVNTVDIAAGDTPFGYWAQGEERVLDGMNAIANSLGVWFGFDRLNLLRMAQFTAPSGTPAWTLTQHNILRNGIRRITTQDPGRGVPVWRVVARSNHNQAPTDTFAGAVSEADKALMREEWPVETAVEDATVLTWCPAATEMVVDVYSAATGPTSTGGSTQTDDAGEAQRRLSLYANTAEMVQVEVPATPLLLTSLDIGSVVRLQFPRYGWTAGQDFIVVGVRTE